MTEDGIAPLKEKDERCQFFPEKDKDERCQFFLEKDCLKLVMDNNFEKLLFQIPCSFTTIFSFQSSLKQVLFPNVDLDYSYTIVSQSDKHVNYYFDFPSEHRFLIEKQLARLDWNILVKDWLNDISVPKLQDILIHKLKRRTISYDYYRTTYFIEAQMYFQDKYGLEKTKWMNSWIEETWQTFACYR